MVLFGLAPELATATWSSSARGGQQSQLREALFTPSRRRGALDLHNPGSLKSFETFD